MPKPQWGWFVVAIAAALTGIGLIYLGFGTFDNSSGPPGGLVIGGLALLAVWAFGKAFFNFRDPRDSADR